MWHGQIQAIEIARAGKNTDSGGGASTSEIMGQELQKNCEIKSWEGQAGSESEQLKLQELVKL